MEFEISFIDLGESGQICEKCWEEYYHIIKMRGNKIEKTMLICPSCLDMQESENEV